MKRVSAAGAHQAGVKRHYVAGLPARPSRRSLTSPAHTGDSGRSLSWRCPCHLHLTDGSPALMRSLGGRVGKAWLSACGPWSVAPAGLDAILLWWVCWPGVAKLRHAPLSQLFQPPASAVSGEMQPRPAADNDGCMYSPYSVQQPIATPNRHRGCAVSCKSTQPRNLNHPAVWMRLPIEQRGSRGSFRGKQRHRYQVS